MVGGTSLDQLIKTFKAADQSFTTRRTDSGTEVRSDGNSWFFDKSGELRDFTDRHAAFRPQRKR